MSLSNSTSPTHKAKSRRRDELTSTISDQQPRQILRWGPGPESYSGLPGHAFVLDTDNFSVARQLKSEADQAEKSAAELDVQANQMRQRAARLRQLASKFERAGVNV